jgi:hypothetical protein
MEMFSFAGEENAKLIKIMYLKLLDCLCLHMMKPPSRQLLQYRDVHTSDNWWIWIRRRVNACGRLPRMMHWGRYGDEEHV